MILVTLFIEFFKTGLFAVGGGLATLPFVYRMVDVHAWFDQELVADMIAVSQSAPGPIGVNLATYVGFYLSGPVGAVTAVLGLISPSIVVILIIARALLSFKNNAVVASAFRGLRPAAVGLLGAACFGVLNLTLRSVNAPSLAESIKWPELVFFLALYAAIWKFKKHPILYVAAAAAVGVVFSL